MRDWSASGLGQIDADTPAVRDALATCLGEQDVDARREALLALARTGDSRARGALLHRLEDTGTPVWQLELEAASVLADPSLHPALVSLAGRWGDDEDEFSELLRLALARCHPGAASAAHGAEQVALTAVLAHLPPGTTATLSGAYPRTMLTIALPDPVSREEFGLWDDRQDPSNYLVRDLLNAVRGTLDARSAPPFS